MIVSIIILFALLAIALLMLIFVFAFTSSILFGAPYVGTRSEVAHGMLETVGAGKDDVVLDVGCGLGNILRSALDDFHVKKVIGIDVNPFILLLTRFRFRKAIKNGRAEFYRADLRRMKKHSDVTIVTTYLLSGLMAEMPRVLKARVPTSATFISHGFKIPGIDPEKELRVENARMFIYNMHAVVE